MSIRVAARGAQCSVRRRPEGSEAEGVREGETEGASFSFTPFSNKSCTSNSFLFRGSNALCNE